MLVFLAFAVAWLMVGIPLSQLFSNWALSAAQDGRPLRARTSPGATCAPSEARSVCVGRGYAAAAEAGGGRRSCSALRSPACDPGLLGYFTAATAPARVPTLFLGVVPIPHLTGPNPVWFGIIDRRTAPWRRCSSSSLAGMRWQRSTITFVEDRRWCECGAERPRASSVTRGRGLAPQRRMGPGHCEEPDSDRHHRSSLHVGAAAPAGDPNGRAPPVVTSARSCDCGRCQAGRGEAEKPLFITCWLAPSRNRIP